MKVFEEKLSLLDKNKRQKTDKLRKLERKLVAILEAQENELTEIRRRQDQNIESIAKNGVLPTNTSNGVSSHLERIAVGAHDKKQAAKLMDSTETMMKFGFMSMAMTYFTSMNMVGAMKNISTKEMQELDQKDLKHDLLQNLNQTIIEPSKQSQSSVMKWDVNCVVQWLSAIYLAQYEDAFRDASIDGPFLCQLTDDDLKNALGIEHILHRKKMLFGVNQLKTSIRTESPTIQEDYQTPNPPLYSKVSNVPIPDGICILNIFVFSNTTTRFLLKEEQF